MDTVESARARMLGSLQPLGSEVMPLHEAADRTLAETIVATRDQPPFRSSAMDGYAVRATDLACSQFTVIGQSAAGAAYAGALGAGEAVRIFTGAPVPPGADSVIPQERTVRDGSRVSISAAAETMQNIREAGVDFAAGVPLVRAGTSLHSRHIALLAAAGVATVTVSLRPRIALIATGNEIATPGTPAGPYQIYDSATFGLAAMIKSWGAIPVHGPISRDDEEDVSSAIDIAMERADLVVIVGGASVGDYDIVKQSLANRALSITVPKVAVRPGQPTWFGTVGRKPLLGLPGNPAAAFVCAYLFLRSLIDGFLTRDASLVCVPAVLEGEINKSGDFERYWRAVVSVTEDGRLIARPFGNQDSSLVSVFASANALIRRPPKAAAAQTGARVDVLLLDYP
ncbi:MAG: gephyrin-like molybdotransferase Glp [Gammaproteobacteria bacterium]